MHTHTILFAKPIQSFFANPYSKSVFADRRKCTAQLHHKRTICEETQTTHSTDNSTPEPRPLTVATATTGISGAICNLTGHPFDSVKVRMQALKTVQKMWCSGGITSFFRGAVPPL